MNNIDIFRTVAHHFEMINAITATYECMHQNKFSHDNTMFDSTDLFCPNDYINMLILLSISDDCINYDKGILATLSLVLEYEFYTRINALYVFTVCQILKHSPCFCGEIKSIANELYEKMFFILKNGRIISININTLYHDSNKPTSGRSRHDNTARLQILYGYSNYDAYEIRLDLAHKGQEFIHFNNVTPGQTSCCIITDDEYQKIVSEYPEIKKCFISYDNRWALKERINCDLTNGVEDIYNKVSKEKAHDTVFQGNYSEELVDKFINIVACMLPKECRKPFDTDGRYARYCFNYDIIMRNIAWLYEAFLSFENDVVKTIMEDIASKALRYGLVKRDEMDAINTFEKVFEIATIAKSRVR